MRLYTHPAATVGRPVALFIADYDIAVEELVTAPCKAGRTWRAGQPT